jgi:hypothetical protein
MRDTIALDFPEIIIMTSHCLDQLKGDWCHF